MTITDTPPIAAIALFEKAFGAPWRRGPIPTALDVLETELKRYGAWQAPRTLPEPALHGGTETPLLWRRELFSYELQRDWVVSIDKHVAYLAVLGGLELGIGNPQRDDWDSQTEPALLGARPGYWRVYCDFPPPSRLFPDALGRDRRDVFGKSFWITTPTLELAYEQSLEVHVLESWTWPNHRRVLRPFADRVNAARRVLRCPGGAEYGHGLSRSTVHEGGCCGPYEGAQTMLKHVYAPILGGFLARLADRKREVRPPWYRPDWRHHIIAKARANLLRAMARIRPRGFLPIAVYNDALYFAVDDFDRKTLPARIGLQFDELGGWALGGCKPLGEVVGDDHRLSFPRMFGRA